ncbi:MAG: membrane-associated protein [Candidatus Micrarchaeota archaeon]|nr:membrane-associated protein [Candidatus Micrarchaeota archaeon]MDE1851610.1 membrane-associated protein [Candidatus Micrarchaeota archaeon]
MAKVSIKGLAIAAGTTWGLGVGGAGFLAMFGWGGAFVSTLGSLYIGYSATPLGALIGLVLGFIDGAIAGAITACVYNYVTKGKDK